MDSNHRSIIYFNLKKGVTFYLVKLVNSNKNNNKRNKSALILLTLRALHQTILLRLIVLSHDGEVQMDKKEKGKPTE